MLAVNLPGQRRFGDQGLLAWATGSRCVALSVGERELAVLPE
jgi:hypothetical protein